MKVWSNILSGIGFMFQYIIPILLFGNVIPYTHKSLKAGLTAMGYIAVAITIIIISGKLKDRVHSMPKGLARAIMLSLFPLAYWLIVKIGVNYLLELFASIANYWGSIIIFIIISRLFYIISEIVYDKKSEAE